MRIISFREICDMTYEEEPELQAAYTKASFFAFNSAIVRVIAAEVAKLRFVQIGIASAMFDHKKQFRAIKIIPVDLVFKFYNERYLRIKDQAWSRGFFRRNYEYLQRNYPYKFVDDRAYTIAQLQSKHKSNIRKDIGLFFSSTKKA
jgi:hypothetical protein